MTNSKSGRSVDRKKSNKTQSGMSMSFSTSATNEPSLQPASAQPRPKRPRHLIDDDPTITSSPTDDMQSPITQFHNENDSSKACDNSFSEHNKQQQNDCSMIDNVHSNENSSDEEFHEPNENWSKSFTGDNNNFVNFKKNAINKEKNVTPIEISVKNEDKGSLHTLLLRHFKNNTFMWSNASKRSIRIIPFSQTTKDAMIQWLKFRKYQFHTFLNKEMKPNAFIIRGLPSDVTKTHISDALEQAGIIFNTIERHTTGYMRFRQMQSDLWRVTTPNSTKIQHFKSIDGILNVKIRVELLKRSSVLQCKNCQLFFHSAAGCHRNYRCVKCDKDHPPAACPRNTNQSLPVVCCNCHKNHPANDLQHCQFFIRHIQPVIDKRTKDRIQAASVNDKVISNQQAQTTTRADITQASVKHNVSYSNIVKQNIPTNTKTNVTYSQIATASSNVLVKSDLKNLLLQNVQLMSAQQELFKKLSCLIE